METAGSQPTQRLISDLWVFHYPVDDLRESDFRLHVTWGSHIDPIVFYLPFLPLPVSIITSRPRAKLIPSSHDQISSVVIYIKYRLTSRTCSTIPTNFNPSNRPSSQ
jgi:hypothetical protein